jgi:hypothetical protein
MCPGVDSASKIEYQKHPWVYRWPVRKGNNLTNFIVPKVEKNPEALAFGIPKGLLRTVAEKLYLYL